MSIGQDRRLKFASALSDLADPGSAAQVVTESLQQQLGSAVDLVTVFATMNHADDLRDICADIADALEPTVMLGGTFGGVIGVQRELEEGPGLSVLAARLPGVRLRGFSYDQLDWPAVLDAPAALREAVDLGGGSDPESAIPKAVFLLADPFSTPVTGLLPVFHSALGDVPIIGGMFSGARESGRNVLILNDEAMSDGAVGVAIGGAVDVQTTVSQGCRAIGRPMVITRSRRHIVQELGGRNPLMMLRQTVADLNEHDRNLIQHNGVLIGRVINEYQSRFGRGDFLIRHMIGVDADDGYIAIGDTRVRTGQTVQFHLRDAQSAEDDLRMMMAAQQVHGPADGALLFTCNGRGTRLFDKPHTDADIIHGALGDVPLAGAFCAGEIGPVGGQSYLHGHTACLAVFRGTAKVTESEGK
ncbi:MAG: FIST C-terminal domain-containing protein [Phycisphaeraceae bacterium]